jgi:membrane protein
MTVAPPRLHRDNFRTFETPAEAEEPRDAHGRTADAPTEVPARGWRDIILRTWKEFSDDQAPLIAAGVTFYALLALFPGIGAFAAIWGLFADVEDVRSGLAALSSVLPGGAISVIGDQMANVANARSGGLTLAAVGGFLVSLWSANGAMRALLVGIGIAYDEADTRGFVAKTLTSLSFTLGGLGFALATAGLMVVTALVTAAAGATTGRILAIAGWASLFAGLIFGLALLYRYGPSRDRAKWRWVTVGSLFAASAWLAVSLGFSFYAANFGSYDQTYGPLGAVIGFMTWIWISAMVVLLGAELNAETEHQTARDSTVGPPKPLGARGAQMADTIGASQ